MAKTILFKKSNVENKKPDVYDATSHPSGITYGEIAINYNSNCVDVFTLNSSNNVVSIVNDSNFAKYFSNVVKSTNVSALYKGARFNVITYDTSASDTYELTIESGNIIGNEINAIFVNNKTSDITITIPDTINSKPVKSFDGNTITVPNSSNAVNMVEVNVVFDGDTYYIRMA